MGAEDVLDLTNSWGNGLLHLKNFMAVRRDWIRTKYGHARLMSTVAGPALQAEFFNLCRATPAPTLTMFFLPRRFLSGP